jgi:hypothetical protein
MLKQGKLRDLEITFRSPNANRETDSDTEIKIDSIFYYMIVDLNSIYDNGVDYAIIIQWNKTSLQWDRLFLEEASSGVKLLDLDYNISDFYTNSKASEVVGGDRYITFSLDLKNINFPDKYSIILGTGAEYDIWDKSCFIEDISQILPIPPPKYIINPIINNPLILYPNDEETLELEVNSTSPTKSTIYLNSIHNDTTQVTFSPDTLYLNPNEKGISKVKIKTNGASIGTHTIFLSAEASFPQDIELNVLGEKRNYSNPVSSTIPLTSILTITVDPFYQPFIDFINNLEGSLTLIATAVTIISGILGLNIWNKKKRIIGKG